MDILTREFLKRALGKGEKDELRKQCMWNKMTAAPVVGHQQINPTHAVKTLQSIYTVHAFQEFNISLLFY